MDTKSTMSRSLKESKVLVPKSGTYLEAVYYQVLVNLLINFFILTPHYGTKRFSFLCIYAVIGFLCNILAIYQARKGIIGQDTDNLEKSFVSACLANLFNGSLYIIIALIFYIRSYKEFREKGIEAVALARHNKIIRVAVVLISIAVVLYSAFKVALG